MSIKINRIGEINYNKQGLKMRILNYRSSVNIDIIFEDYYISKNKQYNSFKNGEIRNPNFKNNNSIDRTGEVKENKYGSIMKILEYKNNDDVVVIFDSGYKVKTTYNQFKSGGLTSPYCKTKYNIGYLGEGKYETKINGELTLQYKYWSNMIMRCYSKEYKEKYPTYKGVTCCEEWLCFQNFAKWFDDNYYTVDTQTMCLDKDILIKGNKIYSPITCVLVPQNLNKIFTKRQNNRGDCPIGVSFMKDRNKFKVDCSYYNKEENRYERKRLGIYNTKEEAFLIYKNFKEDYIKEMADYYKDLIPNNLYIAMYSYRVEFTD